MNVKTKVASIKVYIPALFIALKKKETPWLAKALAAITVGYALSPIDFIPDFIPILGYVDDLLILPILIALTIRFIPKDTMEICKMEAEDIWKTGLPVNWYFALPIITIWIILVIVVIKYFMS